MRRKTREQALAEASKWFYDNFSKIYDKSDAIPASDDIKIEGIKLEGAFKRRPSVTVHTTEEEMKNMETVYDNK